MAREHAPFRDSRTTFPIDLSTVSMISLCAAGLHRRRARPVLILRRRTPQPPQNYNMAAIVCSSGECPNSTSQTQGVITGTREDEA